MNQLKVTYEDREYEFLGYLDEPKRNGATHYLTFDGHISPSNAVTSTGTAHFRKLPKRHTFGGIVFEETGEKRSTIFEEWFLNRSGYPEIWYQDHDSIVAYTILRRVKVTDAPDD